MPKTRTKAFLNLFWWAFSIFLIGLGVDELVFPTLNWDFDDSLKTLAIINIFFGLLLNPIVKKVLGILFDRELGYVYDLVSIILFFALTLCTMFFGQDFLYGY